MNNCKDCDHCDTVNDSRGARYHPGSNTPTFTVKALRCTFNPSWITVQPEHYCSQFKPKIHLTTERNEK